MLSESPSVDYRTQRADSAEGHGLARKRRSEFFDAVDEHTLADAYPLVGDRAASVEDYGDTVRDDIAGQVLRDADLLGFWLAWHHAGGFARLQAAGWHRATIFRKIKNFRDRYGEHPDTYQPDWIHLDLPAAWAAELAERLPQQAPAVTATDHDASQLLLTPEQAARALGIGRTRLYQLLAAGQLPSVKLGGSRRISRRALQTYVDRLEGPAVTPADETAPAARPRSHRPAPASHAEPLSLPFS